MDGTYYNPNHPRVSAGQHSNFSTLNGAVFSSIQHGPKYILGANREGIPQEYWVPENKWDQVMRRSREINDAIEFDHLNHSRQGLPLSEIKNKGMDSVARVMKGGNDCVADQIRASRINLRVVWPGYKHVDYVRSIEIDPHITRAQLGGKVAAIILNFLEVNGKVDVNTEYNIGPNGIRFHRLVLVQVKNVFDDVWQAMLALDTTK